MIQLGFLIYAVTRLCTSAISSPLPRLLLTLAIKPTWDQHCDLRPDSSIQLHTRKIAEREICDVRAADLQRHGVVRKAELALRVHAPFVIGLVVQKGLRRDLGVQDGELRTANTFFNLGLVIDDASEGVIASLAKGLPVGVGDEAQGDYALPRRVASRQATFSRAPGGTD